MDDSIRIRFCQGGESVNNGEAQTACHYCDGGVCRQMQACEQPEPQSKDEPEPAAGFF